MARVISSGITHLLAGAHRDPNNEAANHIAPQDRALWCHFTQRGNCRLCGLWALLRRGALQRRWRLGRRQLAGPGRNSSHQHLELLAGLYADRQLQRGQAGEILPRAAGDRQIADPAFDLQGQSVGIARGKSRRPSPCPGQRNHVRSRHCRPIDRRDRSLRDATPIDHQFVRRKAKPPGVPIDLLGRTSNVCGARWVAAGPGLSTTVNCRFR